MLNKSITYPSSRLFGPLLHITKTKFDRPGKIAMHWVFIGVAATKGVTFIKAPIKKLSIEFSVYKFLMMLFIAFLAIGLLVFVVL